MAIFENNYQINHWKLEKIIPINLRLILQVLILSSISFSCSTAKKQVSGTNTIDGVIQAARSYTGVPYRWGGTTRAGMDCSGLIYNSFLSLGIEMPRTTAEQARVGRAVSVNDLREGDLVFFAAGKSPAKITHVGLVTQIRSKRDVQFIHASSSLGVIENNIFSDYYRRIFVKAVRPF